MAAFLGTVVLEHLLEPQLDPARHTVSEYARTGSRALITVAFAGWAVSLIASAALTYRTGRTHRAIPALLAIAAVGMLLVASFRTQTSATRLAYGHSFSTGGRLHDLGSALTALALLGASAISAWLGRPSQLTRWLAGLVGLAVVIQVGLLLGGGSVSGLRQRGLILVGLAAQILIIRSGQNRN